MKWILITIIIMFSCASYAFSLDDNNKTDNADTANNNNNDSNEYLYRSINTLDRLTVCSYNNDSGLFNDELAWQTGVSLQSIANIMYWTSKYNGTIINTTSIHFDALYSLLNNTLDKQVDVNDKCFDDHQWYLLAWIMSYEATKDIRFITRAAEIFDLTAVDGWNPSCGGGISWCPSNNYKNAITNELFFTAAALLDQYQVVLNKTKDYYLNYANQVYDWFYHSGMINYNYTNTYNHYSKDVYNNNQDNQYLNPVPGVLINDGLTDDCKNNGQTTWTYNQGVLLSGLIVLYLKTNNDTYIYLASNITSSVMSYLTVLDNNTNYNILQEPCEKNNYNCDSDQHIFKGIFIYHLSFLLTKLENKRVDIHLFPYDEAVQFIIHNSNSLINNICLNGDLSLNWNGLCQSSSIASSSSGLNLIFASWLHSLSNNNHYSTNSYNNKDNKWLSLGIGNCMDDDGASMSNCYNPTVSENVCRAIAMIDPQAVAYDIFYDCSFNIIGSGGACRIRTLSDPSQCPQGWKFEKGNATQVTSTNQNKFTLCFKKM